MPSGEGIRISIWSAVPPITGGLSLADTGGFRLGEILIDAIGNQGAIGGAVSRNLQLVALGVPIAYLNGERGYAQQARQQNAEDNRNAAAGVAEQSSCHMC